MMFLYIWGLYIYYNNIVYTSNKDYISPVFRFESIPIVREVWDLFRGIEYKGKGMAVKQRWYLRPFFSLTMVGGRWTLRPKWKEMGSFIVKFCLPILFFLLLTYVTPLSSIGVPFVIGANRYWVGGTGNVSDNTNHWSASSGGAPGASKPGASDWGIIDSNSDTGSAFVITWDEATTWDYGSWSNDQGATLNFSGFAFTVNKECLPGDKITVNCSNSTVKIGDGYTANHSFEPLSGCVWNGGSGTHTYGNIWAGAGQVTLTNGLTKINGYHSSVSNVAFRVHQSVTWSHANGTVQFEHATGTQRLYRDNNSSFTAFYNLIVNKNSGVKIEFVNAYGFICTTANDFTLTSGEVEPAETDNTPFEWIVNGNSSITGLLYGATNIPLTFKGNVVINGGGQLSQGTAVKIEGNLTNSGTITGGSSTTYTLGTDVSACTFANSSVFNVGLSTVYAKNASFIVIATGTDWNHDSAAGTVNYKWIDFRFDIATGGGGIIVQIDGAITVDKVTVSSGDTWKCTVINTAITCDSAKEWIIQGTIQMTGTSGNEITIGTLNYMQLNGGSTVNMQYVDLTGTIETLYINYTSPATVTNLDNLTLVSTTRAALGVVNNATIPIITNSTISGTDGVLWYQQDVYVEVGHALVLDNCTYTTIGMNNSSGYIIAVDGSDNYTIYGILASASAPTGYKAVNITGNLQTSQATVYGVSFNTAYTLSNNAPNVDDVTIDISTSLIDNGKTLSFSGDWVRNGTWTATGSAILTGTSQTIYDSNTWKNFTKSVAAADTLTFEASTTQTFTGQVTLNGASGQLLSLVSDNPGTIWNFTMNAGASKGTMQYLSVTDSDATGSDASHKPIKPTNSTDGGNTLAWFAKGNPGIFLGSKYYEAVQ
jgi:hypothetical protein